MLKTLAREQFEELLRHKVDSIKRLAVIERKAYHDATLHTNKTYYFADLGEGKQLVGTFVDEYNYTFDIGANEAEGAPSYGDKLVDMFELQKALQAKTYNRMLPAMLPEYLPMQVTGLIAELGEVLKDQEAWKDWKKNPRPVDPELLEEIVDFWHFVINITLHLGFDATDIYDMFTAKNKVNNTRQDTGY